MAGQWPLLEIRRLPTPGLSLHVGWTGAPAYLTGRIWTLVTGRPAILGPRDVLAGAPFIPVEVTRCSFPMVLIPRRLPGA